MNHMEENIFQSALSTEEIEQNFENFDFYTGLSESLNEALAHAKGEDVPGTVVRKRSLPDVNVAEVRASVHMTQKAFASVLGVSSRTVEAWECGRSNPTPTARKLIYLIQEDHAIVNRLQKA